MGLGKFTSGGIAAVVLRWANGLRFPYLFLLTLVLFVVNLFVPDVIPLADELIMGLVTMMLASLRKKKPAAEASQPEQPAEGPDTP